MTIRFTLTLAVEGAAADGITGTHVIPPPSSEAR